MTFGQADKGSQKYIQEYVNRLTDQLNFWTFQYMMKADRSLTVVRNESFEWVSPLEGENYCEYSDGAFLSRLGLDQHQDKLKDFWPSGGPCWDALAKVRLPLSDGEIPGVRAGETNGFILVEAKAHLGEFAENDKTRALGASLEKIRKALDEARTFFGVPQTAPCWTSTHYQACNRLAHLYFMNEVLKVPTWLVWFLVLDAPEWPNDNADIQAWEKCLSGIYSRIGLPKGHPLNNRIVTVFARPSID